MKHNITIYMKHGCSFCDRAVSLLAKKGVTEFTSLRTDLDESLREQMIRRTGQRTVPQIYIGDIYVGGYAQLVVREHVGELDELVARAAEIA